MRKARTTSKTSPAAQLARLEYFFRDEVDGEDLGRRGDYDNLTAVDTAIRAMRELVQLINGDRAVTRLELRNVGARLGHTAQRFRIDRHPEARELAKATLADLRMEQSVERTMRRRKLIDQYRAGTRKVVES